jgi:GTPase SAR1 family protein
MLAELVVPLLAPSGMSAPPSSAHTRHACLLHAKDRLSKAWPGLIPLLEGCTEVNPDKRMTSSDALTALTGAKPSDPQHQRSLGGAVKACVIGTAKAGKSTFINALLGREYLPVDSAPETVSAILVQGSTEPDHADGSLYVFDSRNEDGGAGLLLASGQSAINTKLKAINALQRAQGVNAVTLPDVGVLLPSGVPQLVLKVPFPASLTGPSAEGAFDLYDTPGPNEAAEGVRELVESNARRVLANADVVILVIDFTQMGTTQEMDLLE